MMERTVTVNGVSRLCHDGMAHRLHRSAEMIAPPRKLQGQFTSGASGISQKATNTP